MRTRREFLRGTMGMAGGAALGSLAARAARGQTPPKPPNVLLIITDDQGYGDLGCHGNPVLKTPNLDRLHAESVRFTRFNVCPVCSPTRACLMTGRYNYRTGVVDTYAGRSMMDPGETTLAEMFGAAGHRTGIFGKWHLGDNHPLRPMDRGFQESLVHFGGGIAQPSDPEFYERENTYFDPVLQRNGTAEKRAGYCTDIFTDAALEFILAPRKTSFFAYVSYNAPHTPLQVPESDAAPYLTAGLAEKTAKAYGMIANTDRNIGRLLDALDTAGLARDTLVIFMTDNGAQDLGTGDRFNAGLRDWKGSVYDGGIRVPFFVRWPAAFAGGRDVDRIGAHIDITPTLLDACGAVPATPPLFDGVSLMPLLRDVPADAWADRTLFFQWHRGDAPEAFRNAAVRTQRWKMVDGKELYDMDADPGETRDVAAAHPDTVNALRGAYEKWFADVGATRGYAPVRIHLGSDRQNPVILSRQDWRGQENWMADAPGFWEVHVVRPGEYTAEITFPPAKNAGTARIRFGGAEGSSAVEAGAKKVRITGIHPVPGDTRLECWLEHEEGARVAARFVAVGRK